jgi:hypothetical protein
MIIGMTWSRGAAVTFLTVAGVAIVCSLGLLTGAIPASGGGPNTTRNIALIIGGVAGLPFGLLGLWALASYRRARRVLTGGEPGSAQVLRLRETGNEYSGVPQLELRLSVTTATHGTYVTTVKDLVPTLRWAQLTMHGQVPVRVDRTDRDRVLLDWDRETPAVVTAVPRPASMAPVPPPVSTAPVPPAGTRGKGVLLGVTPSLTYDGEGNPVFDVVLHVEAAGRPSASVPARFGVPLDRVAGMVVGAEIAVRVGPDGAVIPVWR